MELPYEISTSKSKAKVKVVIDRPYATQIPLKLVLGIGNKAKWYRDHLNKTFASGDHTFIQFVTMIHKTAKEHGSIEFVCKCGCKYHGQVLKEFITDNQEAIEAMVPYIFPQVAQQETTEEPKSETDASVIENHVEQQPT